jgi:hypothetical protein
MTARLLAMLPTNAPPSTVKHYAGLPPELTDGNDARREVDATAFFVIEGKPDGMFLYRFNRSGQCVSDTWHLNINDAKDQAAYEYEGVVLVWDDVPQSVLDVGEYGLIRNGA